VHALSFILCQVVVVDAYDDDHQLNRAESLNDLSNNIAAIKDVASMARMR